MFQATGYTETTCNNTAKNGGYLVLWKRLLIALTCIRKVCKKISHSKFSNRRKKKKKNTNPKPHGQMDYWITHNSEEQDTALVKLISSNKGWKITNKVAKIQCFKETH